MHGRRSARISTSSWPNSQGGHWPKWQFPRVRLNWWPMLGILVWLLSAGVMALIVWWLLSTLINILVP
jgi:hypothetical protein